MKTTSLSAVLSVVVLLIFSYISFLGLVYWQNGSLIVPLLITIVGIAVIIGCLFCMCMAKATRWRNIGKPMEIIFAIIIFVVLILSAVPFTNFVKVVQNKDTIVGEVQKTCESAQNIDAAYTEYVNKRIDSYKMNLGIISKGKTMNASRYQQCLGKAAGTTDEQKIQNLANSLQRRLVPDSTATIVKERMEFLNSAKNATVWNIFMPKNIVKVNESVQGWLKNYEDLSSVSYLGEETTQFKYDDFTNQLAELTQSYTKLTLPKPVPVILAVLCALIMLLPYWLTVRFIGTGNVLGDIDAI